MPDVAVLMPSLRPHLWDEIRFNVEDTSDATLIPLGEEYGSYAEAINEGWKLTDADYFFTSDDDVVYEDGWLEHALAEMKDGIQVVGTNDLHNPYVLQETHSTHSLVDRRYIEEVGGVIDAGPGSFLYPYDHNYTDAEFIETARARGVFAPCKKAIVEHYHWEFGKRDKDKIAEKTRRKWHADWQTFMDRRHLWVDKLEVVHEYAEPPRD